MRVTSCSDGISMLKIATEALMSGLTAAYSAMLTRERGLAHRGPAGDDDQIPGAQAAGLVVEIGEAGRQSAQLVRIAVPLIDLVDQRAAAAR